MAVAGLQNVSGFGPSFFEESRSSMSTASSVLRMWRELENEHVVNHSHNKSMEQKSGPGSECCSTTTSVGQGSENGDDITENGDEIGNQGLEMVDEDNNSVISEQSSDLGETERKRVRQIFREWMNCGGKVDSSNRFRPGPELGENECGRVRIIREWVQMSTQQINNCGSNGNGELDSQIEQVRDGLVINHPEIGGRRHIRRLCGRQTLVDLLVRAQTEREREIWGLLERRAVSEFSHRNRIQALLRGRFLRNQTLLPDERPPLKAATELGFLKQRQTVSDLREGFLSRMDSSASTSSNNIVDDSSGPEINGALEHTRREMKVTMIRTVSNLEISDDGNSSEELTKQVSETQDQILCNDGGEQEEVTFHFGSYPNAEEPVLNTEANEPVLNTEANEQEILAEVNLPSSRHDEQINVTITADSLLETEDIANSVGPLEVSHEHSELRNETGVVHEAATHSTEFEINANEEFNLQNTLAENLQESSTDQWFNVTSGEVAVQDQMMESREQWPTHDFQGAIDSWLDLPTADIVVGSSSAGRIDPSYFSDDDNVQNTELRELFSRGRVSSLLGSSFRENLNRVLQSHVERLGGHASSDWESGNEQDEEQQQLTAEQYAALDNGNPFAHAPAMVNAPDLLWNEDWMHNSLNQQFGTEYDVINDLRIDMARLQQRMNQMQNMLETCMEMQIELQRAVRQEVSAALNRSIFSKVASKCETSQDESQWDQVRRGICCLCSNSNVNSLLYRCGHMCTCSKCAENLVEGAGKCPMCQAPVVEVVRAYFAQ